ncbi:MarR family transcriptional regulator [Lachnospiraceae bacterium 29-91]|jgi:MarR family transcriptional repressor of mepA
MDDIQYTKWILRLSNQVRRIFNTYTNNKGTQTRILYFVLSNYPQKDIYQKDIEAELNIRSSSISVFLKKLEEQELIIKEKVPFDDRLKRICPTSTSMKLKKEIDKDILSLETKMIYGISQKNLNIFVEVLKKMIKNLEV